MAPRSVDVSGGMPRNYLLACLLLLIAERSRHGYDLLEGIRQLGPTTVDPGGLYRTLRRMEGDGLVSSHWEDSDAGPARRSYRITAGGREWLHAWAGALHETHSYLGRYLQQYTAVTGNDIPVEGRQRTPAP